MTTLLALDTSTSSLTLAVVRIGEGVVATRDRGPGPNHSTLLPALVGEVLEEASLTLGELDGIAVGIGPGAFTGLRIALSTAKGLAYGARLPLAGVSSLQAMEHAGRKRTPAAASVVALLDARKGELYVRLAGEESVASPQEVARRVAELPRPVLLLGEGYLLHRSILDEAAGGALAPDGVPLTPPALDLAELAAPHMGIFSHERIFALEPRYLRSTAGDLSLGPRPV